MQITFKENTSITNYGNGPKFIRMTSPLILPGHFAPYEVKNKVIDSRTQMGWLNEILTNNEIGWFGLICGDIEAIRLMAYYIATQTKPFGTYWQYIGGSRYVEQKKDSGGPTLIYVVDSLVSFDGQIDPIRFGNVFDFVSKNRGKSSMIVLSTLEVEETCQKAHLRPDYMWYINPKKLREA